MCTPYNMDIIYPDAGILTFLDNLCMVTITLIWIFHSLVCILINKHMYTEVKHS